MAKKITGIVLIIIGCIPFIMRILRMFSGGSGLRGRGVGLPSGNMPIPSGIPSGMTPGGGPPDGGLFGILGTLGPYLNVIAIILIVVGIILFTHKEKGGKNTH